MMRAFLLTSFLPSLALCFSPLTKTSPASGSLGMAPRFDKSLNKWVPTSPDEGPEAGYGIWGSLLRQGPLPFFNRIFKPDDYDQAVLKFMAGDKVGRNQAQAEMDAYLQNPNDWTYNRLNGYKPDYLTIDKKQVGLTLVWSTLVLSVSARAFITLQTGEKFWDFLN